MEMTKEARDRLRELAHFSSKSGAFGRAIKKAHEQTFRADLRALLSAYDAQAERLERYEALLRECYRDYAHPNFTDRHNMAGSIKAALTQSPPAMENGE